ncbi:carbohydrate kinase family protein [Methanohalophilus mahii]|uniref:Adenosine kinase n=1 Tax=Methanohalophilus mahii (strain ATCC 35705 / DSM 5219 / SLP) TaxID=547558 RepID=D5EA52_METMS|nr:carbohydrate kinase family protein [Methanohalophilus mahii]ADE36053.1 Adenosine kinase [Methanohalophilus mahii DSM 5219]
MDKALICGSFAFDNIMVFNDQFKNHILPDKVHILNVSFLVPELRREFGGCAGNIAYNLKLLGGDPLPMGTVGTDFEHYAKWMDEKGINREYVNVVNDTFTAQAFITTDMDDNQITAFHPGAMDYSHNYSVLDVNDPVVGIVAPDGREGMLQHASEFAEAKIPFIFDPGQGLPMFNGDELMEFIKQATWLTVNDYEWQLIKERTGKSQEEIATYLDALIITKGPEGSLIYSNDEIIQIPAAKPNVLKDPTGCGDAYRAGLLYGLINDMDWDTTGRIASLMGAIKIEYQGTQNHHFKLADFKRRFKESFGTVF